MMQKNYLALTSMMMIFKVEMYKYLIPILIILNNSITTFDNAVRTKTLLQI